jgi:hypothetical protein
VRAVHYGAPGHLEEGRVEVGDNTGGPVCPILWNPHLGLGIKDWFAIEAGGSVAPGLWTMGYIGPRFSLVSPRESPVRLLADIELGAGAGIGGELHNNQPQDKDCLDCDNRQWNQRLAYGGYQGVGLGLQAHWFSIYLRGRVEESKATNIPLTLWPSFLIGMEANIKRRAAINAGTGLMWYTNSADHSEAFWIFQLGFSVFIDGYSKPRTTALQ